MHNVRVGIIGLGRLGAVHAQNLAFSIHGAELTAVCAGSEAKLDWAKGHLNVSEFYTDYRAMIDTADLDAIVIVSPSPMHTEMISYAMNAGKHVFCEKPLGCTIEECLRAEEAVEAHPELVFLLGFMRRYDPSYADAKQKLDSGSYGTPYLVKATSLDPEAVIEGCIRFSATSGGIFIDAASHDIDLMRWYLGGNITEVYALGTNFKHPEFPEYGDTETGLALIRFDNGKCGFLHVGRTAPHGYHTETEIVCTDGHLRVSGIPWKNRLSIFDKNGAVQPIIEDFPQRFAEAYRLELQEFISCILERRKPEQTVYDGTAATKACYAITESFHSGKPVLL